MKNITQRTPSQEVQISEIGCHVGKWIHNYKEQVCKMERRGMQVEAFESFLQMHRYGMPPHGGLGLGLERLTARLLGFDNVRFATLFPRDTHRLVP